MSKKDIDLHETVCVASTHPCLPGHFPGQPIVPGVLLLDHLAARLASSGLGPILRLATVKFRAPLLPDQEVEMHIHVTDGHLRFRFVREDLTLASGEGELA